MRVSLVGWESHPSCPLHLCSSHRLLVLTAFTLTTLHHGDSATRILGCTTFFSSSHRGIWRAFVPSRMASAMFKLHSFASSSSYSLSISSERTDCRTTVRCRRNIQRHRIARRHRIYYRNCSISQNGSMPATIPYPTLSR